MDRRRFLMSSGKIAGGAAVAPLLPRLFASPALALPATGSYKALVCLNLYGGNDGNNTLVPIDNFYNEYASGRGSLALAQNSLLPLAATSSGRLFGAHPSLANVSTLYNQGHAAFVANTGPLNAPLTPASLANGVSHPYNLMDHQSQAAEWEAGISLTISSTGWAGRMADLFAGSAGSATIPTVISTAGWSLLGRGKSTDSVSVSLTPPTAASMSALQTLAPVMSQLEHGDPLNHLHDQISQRQTALVQENATVTAVIQAGAGMQTPFPTTSIGQQLKLIAQMIYGRSASGTARQVFFCQDGNAYDTHISQLNVHAKNLAEVDAAVGAFAAAMIEIGMFNNVTLFTMSDFGRSKQANSTAGCDHGWGNHHFIVGGAVKGGQLYGTFPSLVIGGDNDQGTTGIWIPTTSSSQYAATLSRWMDVSASNTAAIFPELANFQTSTLGFI